MIEITGKNNTDGEHNKCDTCASCSISVPGRNALQRGGEGGLYCSSGGNEDGPSEGGDLVGWIDWQLVDTSLLVSRFSHPTMMTLIEIWSPVPQ